MVKNFARVLSTPFLKILATPLHAAWRLSRNTVCGHAWNMLWLNFVHSNYEMRCVKIDGFLHVIVICGWANSDRDVTKNTICGPCIQTFPFAVSLKYFMSPSPIDLTSKHLLADYKSLRCNLLCIVKKKHTTESCRFQRCMKWRYVK